MFTKVSIQNFRNIESTLLMPVADLNILTGENGSGKTSVLEALFLLSNGRSFRTNDTKQLINFDTQSFLVRSELLADGVNKSRVAISYDKKSSRVAKINNQKIFASAELAKLVPTKFLSPTVGEMITGSPKSRRKFMDWLMFHVEHEYLNNIKHLKHVVTQRNAILKQNQNKQELFWRENLIELSNELYAKSDTHFKNLQPFIDKAISSLLPNIKIDVRIYPGWNLSKPLDEIINSNFSMEFRVGSCRYGFHRRDLKVTVNGRSVRDVLSRGQLKLTAIALQIAQISYLKEIYNRKCVVFIDDLISELDVSNAEKVIDELVELGVQCFITSASNSLIEITSNNFRDRIRLFHVERGTIMQEESL